MMLEDWLPDALADTLGGVIAEQRRAWQLEHDRNMAECRALLADTRRENSVLQLELRTAIEALVSKVETTLSNVKDGEPGLQGPPGERGERGETGPQGIPGERGEPGPQGIPGEVGERGERGEAGPQGLPGERGEIGETGPQGLPGERGEIGEIGPQGLPGEAGARGEVGETGPQGLPGEAGERGLQGPAGERGEDGVGISAIERTVDNLEVILSDGRRLALGELPRGEKGDTGPPGESIKGDPGEPGTEGPRGEKGDPGEHGVEGPRGEKGDPGERGVGIAVIERDAEHIFVKLDDGQIVDLGELPRGEKGDPGESIIGPEGPPGLAGESIIGPEGPPGPAGESIRGEKGEKGDPGVGIACIERDGSRILFILDDERRFDIGELPRGEKGEKGDPGQDGTSFIDGFIDRSGALILTRDNGTTREIRDIAGRDGADGAPGKDGRDGLGFDDLSFAYDGERRFTMRYARDSAVKEFQFEIPVMLYRGIYKDGEQYSVGDVVTRSGSLWHYDSETNDPPGEDKTGWTLIAKKGRDGRDGKDGERGLPGPEGKPGKDLTQLGPDGKKW